MLCTWWRVSDQYTYLVRMPNISCNIRTFGSSLKFSYVWKVMYEFVAIFLHPDFMTLIRLSHILQSIKFSIDHIRKGKLLNWLILSISDPSSRVKITQYYIQITIYLPLLHPQPTSYPRGTFTKTAPLGQRGERNTWETATAFTFHQVTFAHVNNPTEWFASGEEVVKTTLIPGSDSNGVRTRRHQGGFTVRSKGDTFWRP